MAYAVGFSSAWSSVGSRRVLESLWSGLYRHRDRDRLGAGLHVSPADLVWASHDGGLAMSGVTISNGVVFAGAAYGYGSIYMYDALHGWLLGIIPGMGSVSWPLAMKRGILYFGTNEGKVYALQMSMPNSLLT